MMACPGCIEKEREKEIATRGHHFRRGLLFATGAALVASLVLWGIEELSTMGSSGGGLFSPGAFLRGFAVIFAGRLVGALARDGAKKRGSRSLQVSVFLLTYLAWAMSFVWLLLGRVPGTTSSVLRILSIVAMGPILPWIMVIKNPESISGIIVVAMACFAAWNATAKLELVSGPFDITDKHAERPMFKSLT